MQSISMEVQKGKEDSLTKEINADVLCFNASTCIQFRPMVNQVLTPNGPLIQLWCARSKWNMDLKIIFSS